MSSKEINSRVVLGTAALGLMGAFTLSVAAADEVLSPAEAQARASWRSDIAQIETPAGGCFRASYPNLFWEKVGCRAGQPRVHPVPRTPKATRAYVVGDGHDYAAGVNGLISKAVGSFPLVLGVRSEASVGVPLFGDGGILGPNEYTLQMNSNADVASAACDGGSPGCIIWQQFIYSPDYLVEGEAAVFIQYWLIGYGVNGTANCPAGWYDYGEDCYTNSAYATAPDLPISELGHEKMSASVVADGKDTVVFSHDKEAYSLSAPDRVLDLATVWHQVEFNVLGNAGGSEAVFNRDSFLLVNLAVSSGAWAAPKCLQNAGTTGETNNLNLGRCNALPGPVSAILFQESNFTR